MICLNKLFFFKILTAVLIINMRLGLTCGRQELIFGTIKEFPYSRGLMLIITMWRSEL